MLSGTTTALRLIQIFAMALFFSCARGGEWTAPLVIEESAFQLLRAIDLQQSLDMKHLHEFESNCVLDGGWIIGNRPSARAQYEYTAAEMLAHVAVAHVLVRFAPWWAAHAWEVLTITIDGTTVASNARIGLRLHL